MGDVPVVGAGNGHVGDAEVFVQYIEAGRGAAAPRDGDSRARLVGKDLRGTVEHPVEEGQDAAAGVGIVDGCAEYKAVCFFRLGDKGVHTVVRTEDAAVIGTPSAADAVAHRQSADVEDLVFDPLPLKLLSDLLESCRGVALRLGAAVEHQDFHMDSSCFLSVY